jgi:PAS domain S-box-containing protein
MLQEVKILLIEDDEDDALLTQEYLQDIGNYNFIVEWEPNSDKARVKLTDGNYDIFLIDYNLGGVTGLSLINHIKGFQILTPAIILTGRADSAIDVDASSAGAFDYLVKGELTAPILERSIRYALSQAKIIRELNEKEKKYRSLFERSIDCIFLANENFKIVDANDSFLNFFEYSVEEVKTLAIGDLFVDKSEYEQCRTELKGVEQIRDYEVEFITKSGEQKICMVNCVFIPDQASDFCCYQGIIRDLTLRKKAELDLLVAERLSMTGRIARTIAHEIRNPLTNLNLALENLKDEMPPESETAKTYADIINRNSNRIETLMSDLLKSSKPKELQLELISVNDLIVDTLALANDRINLKGIKLITNYSVDLPRLYVDREKIMIAFLNIIINGIEAIDKENGELRINTIRVTDAIHVVIEDNGVGIEKSEISKLFDPFYTAKPNGSGLGLTSTLNILSSHNAKIIVNSTVGVGTIFTLQFKLAEM